MYTQLLIAIALEYLWREYPKHFGMRDMLREEFALSELAAFWLEWCEKEYTK